MGFLVLEPDCCTRVYCWNTRRSHLNKKLLALGKNALWIHSIKGNKTTLNILKTLLYREPKLWRFLWWPTSPSWNWICEIIVWREWAPLPSLTCSKRTATSQVTHTASTLQYWLVSCWTFISSVNFKSVWSYPWDSLVMYFVEEHGDRTVWNLLEPSILQGVLSFLSCTVISEHTQRC